ncbi:MAG: glycosyltransferase family 39 protein [Nanoarchaeota archaeon]
MNKEKIKSWMKEKHNSLFLLILLFALGIRLLYLNANAAVWWDEASYLSTAKHWFFNVNYVPNPQNAVFFPLLLGIFLKIGLNELLVKFLIVVIPSAGIVAVTYLLGKEMYDESIGLIASFIMSVFWVSVFWTTRFQPDFLALFFQILSIYYFWIWYKHKKNMNLYLAGLFLGLAFITRTQSILLAGIYIIFLLITENITKIIKNKHLWITGIISFLTVLPYLIYNQINYKKVLAFSSGYNSQIVSNTPFGWHILNFLKTYTGFDAISWVYFILFIVGIVTLLDLILGFDQIRKSDNIKIKADLMNVIIMLAVLAFFIFYIRVAEDRWIILTAAPMFYFIGKGIYYILGFFKNMKISIKVFIILIILILGAYSQLTTADTFIQQKKDSYLQVKQASIWLKENTNTNDKIVSNSAPQMTYYTEREILDWGENETVFNEIWDKEKPKYYVISGFERHSDWVYAYPQNHQDILVPVKSYTIDGKQPILVIFEAKH